VPSTSPVTEKPGFAAEAQSALEERRAVLGSCLAAMGFSECGGPPAVLPEQLKFDGHAVPLESWERNVLLGQSSGETEIVLAHLAEGIAFRAKCQSALLRLEHAPPSAGERSSFMTALIEDTAAGLALQKEVQRDIDRLVKKGEMTEAKKLTGFRRKIDHGLASLKQRLGAEAHEQAQARSIEMLTPLGSEPAPRKRVLPSTEMLDLPALPRPTPADREAPKPEAHEPTPEELFEKGLIEQEQHEHGTLNRQAPVLDGDGTLEARAQKRVARLITLLAVCLLLYGAFLLARNPVDIPPRLGMEQFDQFDSVLQVRPRPPSLFIKLDAASWRALAPAGKLELIDSLGRLAGNEGYFGVHVKTNDGRPVGQWMRKTGAELLTTTPGGAS
jgi:hypothetical protein